MDYIYLFLIALSLSIDAFAVAICDGMSLKPKLKHKLVIAGVFGFFQGMMPLIGFFVGALFLDYIKPYDSVVSFVLLLVIGGKMIIDAARSMKSCKVLKENRFNFGLIIMQGIATSIDALAVGITINSLQISVWISVAVIAAVTFGLCLFALLMGEKLEKLFMGKTQIAQIMGGSVLVLIGIKILIGIFFQ